jgi:hypothetical protein
MEKRRGREGKAGMRLKGGTRPGNSTPEASASAINVTCYSRYSCPACAPETPSLHSK